MKNLFRISLAIVFLILIQSCKKDKNTLPIVGTATDIDGNVYNTINIGTQIWMEENLRVLHYTNGDPVQNVTNDNLWSNLTTGAYCWYKNDETQYENVYEALYNYYAVTDDRNICPTNWRIPTQSEWNILQSFLGGNTVAGGKLKESGTSHWYAQNDAATDESKFSSLPVGIEFLLDHLNLYDRRQNIGHQQKQIRL